MMYTYYTQCLQPLQCHFACYPKIAHSHHRSSTWVKCSNTAQQPQEKHGENQAWLCRSKLLFGKPDLKSMVYKGKGQINTVGKVNFPFWICVLYCKLSHEFLLCRLKRNSCKHHYNPVVLRIKNTFTSPKQQLNQQGLYFRLNPY